MEIIASRVGEKLSESSWRLSIAESCTGGLVCKMVTDVPGCSKWFDRGFITYTNESKISMLNVPRELLVAQGAVSLQVVEAMASGALDNSQADIALAISGIAGPGGGTQEKPVGTVCFAWNYKSNESLSEVRLFQGDRESIRLQAANYALEALLRHFL